MGTNYYAKNKTCPMCGQSTNPIHIGKSSGGWQFSFQYNGGKFYTNITEMKIWLADKEIWNEYGEKIPHSDFWELVESKQTHNNMNHAERFPTKNNFVIDGYSFTDGHFS